jgi:DNA-binding response OmpR family regulator
MGKYKILIIEDDSDLREGLSFSFSSDGYDVIETETKKEGLQEIKVAVIWFFLIVTYRMEQGLNFAKRLGVTAIFRLLC